MIHTRLLTTTVQHKGPFQFYRSAVKTEEECTVSNKYLRSVGPIDTFNYSTIRMFSFFRSSAKPRR
jgi:hypothetical protein